MKLQISPVFCNNSVPKQSVTPIRCKTSPAATAKAANPPKSIEKRIKESSRKKSAQRNRFVQNQVVWMFRQFSPSICLSICVLVVVFVPGSHGLINCRLVRCCMLLLGFMLNMLVVCFQELFANNFLRVANLTLPSAERCKRRHWKRRRLAVRRYVTYLTHAVSTARRQRVCVSLRLNCLFATLSWTSKV